MESPVILIAKGGHILASTLLSQSEVLGTGIGKTDLAHGYYKNTAAMLDHEQHYIDGLLANLQANIFSAMVFFSITVRERGFELDRKDQAKKDQQSYPRLRRAKEKHGQNL